MELTRVTPGHDRDEAVDAALRRGVVTDDVLAAADLADGFDQVWQRIRTEVGAEPEVRRSSRWSRRAVVIGTVGAVCLAGAGAAAAGVVAYQANTGVTVEMDGVEHEPLMNVGAPDFVPAARQVAEGIAFAPGYSADLYWGVLVSPGGVRVADPHFAGTDGVRATIMTWASCSWQRTWLAARASGDDATAATAAGHVEDLASDPRLRYYDSAQTGYARAVAEDDAGPIEVSVATGCPDPSPVVAR